MHKKETVYLAGKITGDPNYRKKFEAAARELEAAGFVVMNPALLPEGGFSWEAYMRVSSAMLDECAAACFLPDWKDSRGATQEFERASTTGKRVFMFAEWKAETTRIVISDVKTGKLAFRCLECAKVSVFPAQFGDGRNCPYCYGHLVPIGYAKAVKVYAE